MTNLQKSYSIDEIVNDKGCKWSIGKHGFCTVPCRECHIHQRVEGKILCPCCLERRLID